MYDPRRIRELMTEQGRQSIWLAKQTDYRPESVSRFLNGADPISEQFAIRAAKALGVPTWFLEESTPEQVAV